MNAEVKADAYRGLAWGKAVNSSKFIAGIADDLNGTLSSNSIDYISFGLYPRGSSKSFLFF